MKVVRGIVADMIEKGVVHIVKERPKCTNPLGLVSKLQEDGSLKHRLVLDVSRHVNKFIAVDHVRLSHLDKALEITEPNDLQIVFDLTSAYHHIKIEKSQHKYLGASFENSDGTVVYFQYGYLPFGISSAVHCITKVWKPLTSFLNANGIRNSIYVDDGRILAKNVEEAREKAIFTYNTITRAGWAIEKSKSDSIHDASFSKKYLGFQINTQDMSVSSPERKLEKAKSSLEDLLGREMTPVKHLASVLGLIISMEPSHGMIARISTRSGYADLAEHTDLFGWKGILQIKDATKAELKFFLAHLSESNGRPIQSTLTSIRLESILTNPRAKRLVLNNHAPRNEIYVSDASDSKVFVYDLKNPKETVLETKFTEDQKKLGSGVRELLALLWTVKHWEMQGLRKQRVYWITDSENVVNFIKKGSRRPHVQRIIFELARLVAKAGMDIEPIHLLRSDPRIEVADTGSKRIDSDNWSVDAWSFQKIESLLGEIFNTDLFADHLNARVDRFYSLFYDEKTSGIDAFAQNWNEAGNCWISPPVGLLIETHRKILNSKCKGVVVLPIWESATFFPFFFKSPDQSHFPYSILMIWRPYIVQNEDARNTALFGSVPFQFAALKFDLTTN